MSRDDKIPCVSHLDHPLTPPISARWEERTKTEQLNDLYAILINGKWNDGTEEKLNELVKNGERDDVTEQQVHQLVKIVRDKEWSSKMKKLADDLYRNIMKKEWAAVIKTYKEQKKEKIQMAGITRSKHTALHIAILNKQIDMVKELLENIDPVEIREMTDNRKENPLHLAVSMGQLETCKLLVKMDPELIGAENVEGETPLFLAALHGENEAFYALHPKCPITHLHIKHAKARCKRNDGNTILHLSIRGEHFKLAYQIIHWYPDLIDDVNKDGQTALHLLAQNPSAFRSGCYLGPVDNFIYSCLIVDLDKVVDSDQVVDIASPVPKNYQTCLDLLNLGKRVFKLIVTCVRIWEDIDSKNDDLLPVKNTIPGERQETSNRDPIQDEMSPDSSKHCQREHIGDKTEPQKGPRTEEGSGDSTPQEGHEIQRASKMEKEDSTERPQYPSNCHVFLHFPQFAIELYHVFLHFLQSAIVLFLFVIGLGYFKVRKIKAMKLKHKLTYQIMKRLVLLTELWVYEGTGLKPDTIRAKERIPLPSNVPEDHSTEDEICQDVSASTSKNAPVSDGFEDGEKWKVIMEPIREFTKQVQEIKSGIQRKEVFLEAEKKRSDVYRFKMPEDPKKDDKGISPILVAAKNGVAEIVQEILDAYSLAIYEEDADEKNMLMLAVENRQLHIYDTLRKTYRHQIRIFQKSDKDGNSAIHLAATTGPNQPWRIPGAALQMQWEIKWYEFVKETMPHNIFTTYQNEEGMTPMEVFKEAHKTMLKEGVQWLTNTAQSCSIVAALVATVAYASATTVPGGVEKGIPLLRNTYAFSIFTISSLVALCLSVTSLIMFLSILTSRNEIFDFRNNLPMKLIMGLSSLFISIAAMLVSFCAGHFFDLADQLQHTAFPIYAVTCFPVSIYAVTQFPLYFDLVKSITMTAPKRNN